MSLASEFSFLIKNKINTLGCYISHLKSLTFIKMSEKDAVYVT